MNMRDQILLVSDLFAKASGIGRKRVSTIVFNRGSKLDDIDDGGDLTTGNFERAMLWFSANWPKDTEWPAEIPRPECAEAAA